MTYEVNPITFLIAQRGKQNEFFKTFDLAVNFKSNANVVVLEDTQALKQVLEQLPDTAEFRILIHADIGESGTEKQTQRLKTCISEVKSILGCKHIEPFFVTRSGEVEQQTRSQSKCFVRLKESDIMCCHTSNLSDSAFLQEMKAQSKNYSVNSSKLKIFIGSSSDGFEYAQAIKSVMEDDRTFAKEVDVDVWKDVFGKDNSTNIEVLETALDTYQYGVFVFSPDDTIKISNTIDEKKIPRDNVIFEYGLFMGRKGRSRSFFIMPTSWDGLRIMSDIDALNRFPYTDNENKQSAVRSSCSNIIEAIKKIENM